MPSDEVAIAVAVVALLRLGPLLLVLAWVIRLSIAHIEGIHRLHQSILKLGTNLSNMSAISTLMRVGSKLRMSSDAPVKEAKVTNKNESSIMQ